MPTILTVLTVLTLGTLSFIGLVDAVWISYPLALLMCWIVIMDKYIEDEAFGLFLAPVGVAFFSLYVVTALVGSLLN